MTSDSTAATSELYGCPAWCVRFDHDADVVDADSSPTHYGPTFGAFTPQGRGRMPARVLWFQEADDTETYLRADARALRRLAEEHAGTSEIATQANAVADWLEAAFAEDRATYGCPAWCARFDHDGDWIGPGQPPLHYGPTFGAFTAQGEGPLPDEVVWFHEIEPSQDPDDEVTMLPADAGSLRALADTLGKANAGDVAADLNALADWLDATFAEERSGCHVAWCVMGEHDEQDLHHGPDFGTMIPQGFGAQPEHVVLVSETADDEAVYLPASPEKMRQLAAHAHALADWLEAPRRH